VLGRDIDAHAVYHATLAELIQIFRLPVSHAGVNLIRIDGGSADVQAVVLIPHGRSARAHRLQCRVVRECDRWRVTAVSGALRLIEAGHA